MAESRVVFGRLPLSERSWVLDALRQETVGGALLLLATVIALVWANSPWRDSYHDLANVTVGPAALHLNLTLSTWAADGLLAVFFFIAGLELKHELTVGSLSKPKESVVPIAAALAGMALPAIVFVVAVRAMGQPEAAGAWGIPMATDIAFALAVLAVLGSRLPVALRAFLLTLAVIDDLGAIIVIALFYSDSFSPLPFVAAVGCCIGWALLQRFRVSAWWLLLPLALLTWGLTHAAGIHATIAGVCLGLLTRSRTDPGEDRAPVDILEHRLRPLSAAICVPLFALFSAGVTFIGSDFSVITSPITVAIILGLLVGKPLGVYGGARLVAKFTRAELSPDLRWSDIRSIGLLAGIGFTVSLLIGELAFSDEVALREAKIGILLASVLAAGVAGISLARRRRELAALDQLDGADLDGDGVPDAYQHGG